MVSAMEEEFLGENLRYSSVYSLHVVKWKRHLFALQELEILASREEL